MVEMSVADQVAFDLVFQHMPDDTVGRALRHFDIPEGTLVLSDLQPIDQTAGITRDGVAIPVWPNEIRTEIAVLNAAQSAENNHIETLVRQSGGGYQKH